MKLAKFAFVCAAAASLAAVADEPTYTSTTLAILPVARTLKAMPLTVNFTAADGKALPATKIVKTASLPSDAALYVYDKDNSKYTKYILNNNNAWELANDGKIYTINSSGQLVEESGTQAEANPVARGAAVFLETPTEPTEDFSGKFYVAGTPGSGTKTTVSAGANLIGAPTAAEFNLNGSAATFSSIAETTFTTSGNKIKVKGDMIQVPANDSGMSTIYYYKQGTGWVKAVENNGVTTYSSDGCTIPAGKGFWYIRKTGAADMTITW